MAVGLAAASTRVAVTCACVVACLGAPAAGERMRRRGRGSKHALVWMGGCRPTHARAGGWVCGCVVRGHTLARTHACTRASTRAAQVPTTTAPSLISTHAAADAGGAQDGLRAAHASQRCSLRAGSEGVVVRGVHTGVARCAALHGAEAGAAAAPAWGAGWRRPVCA